MYFILCVLFFLNTQCEFANTKITNITCLDTDDCLRKYTQNDWCKSGVLCLKSYCRIIDSFPCKNNENCNNTLQTCNTKKCRLDSDCDDGRYCNGKETCNKTNGQCLESLTPIECMGGECNETLKECIFVPRLVTKWKNFKNGASIDDQSSSTTSKTINNVVSIKPDPIVKEQQDVITINHHNSTSESVHISQAGIIALISIVLVLFGLMFIIFLLAIFFRGGVTEKIYINNADRDDSY
jgi:hypothetical protein